MADRGKSPSISPAPGPGGKGIASGQRPTRFKLKGFGMGKVNAPNPSLKIEQRGCRGEPLLCAFDSALVYSEDSAISASHGS
jgi:hypothetical protein